MAEFITNDQLQLAFDFVQYTGKHIFLTGKAGTGKTTFLHQLKGNSPKRMVVVAPTGVAAINAGGVTIHSFFQMPFGPYLSPEITGLQQPTGNNQKFNKEKIAILKSLDLLVIDEISMVRADLLDGIDDVLRRYKNKYQPFGGVQLLMIGDLQQLAPVIKDDEWNLLRPYYDSVYFFSSRALKKTDYVSIELTHIFRQRDETFIRLLNRVRDNNIDQATLEELNKRHFPGFVPKDGDGYITLTTHNNQAHELNDSKLNKLTTKGHQYKAVVNGDFPEYIYPTDAELTLKQGAQVMFVKNDSSREKQYYNGKIGVIVRIDEETVRIKCANNEEIEVGSVEWQNTKYTIDEESKEIKESIIGTFSQIPLKLAWAITIHKSQGLTFEKAIIDARAAFAHGQVYVALSRCKTLEGMILSTALSNQCIKSDVRVSTFSCEMEQNPPGPSLLEKSKIDFQQMLVLELFDMLPVVRRLNYCQKLIHEHHDTLQPGLCQLFELMSTKVKDQIAEVSYKFKGQLERLIEEQNNVADNKALQERISKGSEYFSSKCELLILNLITNIEIETDNKTIQKSVTDAIQKLKDEVQLKHICLKGCVAGFEVKKYMKIRANAAVESIELTKKSKSTTYTPDTNIAHPELYQWLKNWRNDKAGQINVERYMILPQKALIDLCQIVPSTLSELKKVKGLGVKKINQFGAEILKIIGDYQKKHNLSPNIIESDQEEDLKIKKQNTKEITRDEFLSGKSIDQIAKERKYSVATIESHIAYFIETGDIGIEKLVDPRKTNMIADWFIQNNTTRTGVAKEYFGDKVSYSELRFVLHHLYHNKSIERMP